MMLGKMYPPMQEGERRQLEIILDYDGRIQITDNAQILVLIDGGGGIPAELQKDIIGVALGIEENPDAVRFFTRAMLAQRIDNLVADAHALLEEHTRLGEEEK